ncbi:MAG TPA: PD-(D/E)XK motif protein [Candidatus Brocadiaceae bacterium]|nr:PD-(D/E)XK motif protein [Candidatus Brocadiaceae bacterium]
MLTVIKDTYRQLIYVRQICNFYVFKNNENMIEQFYELLAGCGYNRIHKEEYRKAKFNIYDDKFFMVNESFPKLTSDCLKKQLNSRVIEIQYTIDLEGLSGEVFEYISFGRYFYSLIYMNKLDFITEELGKLKESGLFINICANKERQRIKR